MDSRTLTNGQNRAWVRLYFIVFNLTVVILMLNVLVGVMIDAVDLYRRESAATALYQEFEDETRRANIVLKRENEARKKAASKHDPHPELDGGTFHPEVMEREAVRKVKGVLCCFKSKAEMQVEREIQLQALLETVNDNELSQITENMNSQLQQTTTHSGRPWSACWETYNKPNDVAEFIPDYKLVMAMTKEYQMKHEEAEADVRGFKEKVIEFIESLPEEDAHRRAKSQAGTHVTPFAHKTAMVAAALRLANIELETTEV